ncbi:MAG: hypothetical protein NZT92_12925 [Abditibacteriales bacterium]|nr:hypothetical protein [Abditibacteriales bacterium]
MFLLPTSSSAAERPNHSTTQLPRLTLVIIDRIDFADLLAADAPTLKRLMNEGAVGLISPRVVGALTSESACVTISAGTPAAADENARDVEVLMAHTNSPTAHGLLLYGVRHKGMTALRRLNQREATRALPGLLGDVLHQHNLTTAVVSSGCRYEAFGQVVSIVADGCGRVDNRHDGDLSIVHVGATLTAASPVRRRTLTALRDVDVALREWLKGVDLRRHRLMILTPCPRTNKKYFPRLAPVIMVGGGIQRGVLTSPSTRQRGLVTLADVAPTVLRYFNLPKDDRMVGQPMTVLPSHNPVAELRRLDAWVAARNRAVAPVVALIVLWQVMATALALVLMRRQPHRLHPLPKFVDGLLLGAVVLPLIALLVSPLVTRGTVVVMALMLVLTCALVGVMMHIARATTSLRYLALMAFLALLVDAMRNGRLTAASIVGNSFATGSRFYGVGNEYVGYFIATALITAGLSHFLEGKSWRAWLWMFLVVFALGSAPWGANFGGATTAAVACSVAIVKARSKQFRGQQLSLVMMMSIVAVVALVGWELLNTPAVQSHIGRTFTHTDGAGFLQIAQRKWQMARHVIGYTPLNYPLLLAIPVLAAVLHWRRGRLKAALAQHRAFEACMVAGVVGAAVALVVNDSGIVMVGTLLGALVPALVLVVREA